jgi:hypothetical protein
MRAQFILDGHRDRYRTEQIARMGVIHVDPIPGAKDWNRMRRSPAIPIGEEEQFKNRASRSCSLVSRTASRLWVIDQIQAAWDTRCPLLGVRIQGLPDEYASLFVGSDPSST